MATPETATASPIGRKTPRVDGPLKVTGAAPYPSDFSFAGLAHAALVLLSITILGVLVLITNFLFSTALVIVMSAVYVVTVSALWWVLPLESRREQSIKVR